MQQIEQIKLIRDEAMERLQSNRDYKILVTLSNLIADLEEVENDPGVDTGRITKLDVYTNDTRQQDGDDHEPIGEDEEDVVAAADNDDRRDTVDRAFEKMSNDLHSDNVEPVAGYGEDPSSDNSFVN